MPDAVPAKDDVTTAIATALASSTGGDVYVGFHTLEDDVEFLIQEGLNGIDFDLFFIETEEEPLEGPASGEGYVRYNSTIRYWSSRVDGNPDWAAEAELVAHAAANDLTDDDDIFSIGGQRSLQGTPTTVSVDGPRQRDIRGGEAGPQMVYEALLKLQVEGRRWL